MPSGSETSWRVLVALLVYNGEEHVGPCLTSLALLKPSAHSVDVLVLDDASPAPGWSERCREMTEALGFGYYRTPRNLGTPRNMNLGMLRAVDAGYDAVVLLNAATIVPANMIPKLLRPLMEDALISSSTAWSNNSGVYSIPNSDPEHLAEVPELVDWISERMDEEFDGQPIPVPSGVGFCMAMPTHVIRDVGLMDPVFGRGYSGGIDWCLRSQTLGYHSVLAPSCFVYHAGSGTTKVGGSIRDGDRIVQAHQAIISERYPLYLSQLVAAPESSILNGMRERGLRRIIISAARENGYRLETSHLHQNAGDTDVVRFRIDPDGEAPVIAAAFEGFEAHFAVGEGGVLPTVESIVGQPPREIRIFDRGRAASELEAEVARSGTIPVLHRAPYWERVL
jgi:GT2 family glycosyltransferase